MSRYKTALPSTLSGVWMSSRIGRAVTNPTSIITKPLMSAISIAVCTEAWTFSLSRWPMYVAMTTFAPSAMPMKRLTMRPMIGPFAPTAATATVRASPVKLPTMATSEAWKSCSKIAVAATGRAKSGSLFQMEPCSMSISCFLTVVPMISLISFCFPLDRAPV